MRDGHLATTIDVRQRGTWRFILGGGSHRIAEPEAHRIDLDPDRPPRVDLYAPGDPLEVAGPRRVELAWSVDDDYGLGAIELVWKAGDAPEKRRAIAPKPAAGHARALGQDRVGPRRDRSEAGRARLVPPRGQGQRHRARPQRRALQDADAVDVQPAREAGARAGRRTGAGRAGGAAPRRSARGQARQRRRARRGVHAHALQGGRARPVAVARRAVGGRGAAEEG